ncbi:MAG: hypothetical protein WDW38_004068 [Sanguina aurantia]
METYTAIIKEYPDFALTEYARIGRALLLYQLGSTSDAILELQDEEVAMQGRAEVHAAMAALLYTERPLQALRAEEEWDFACMFDKRFSNPTYLREQRHWPEKMVAAMMRFQKLQ